ncbi:MAG TPA: HlyD family efflux transporter periplasmic adaptor subunit [Rhodocyclaceae bacterium]|nr:HlyD family efflux transporter periplasmic adaptor subunit [Rhodocyclaceae bacterium]
MTAPPANPEVPKNNNAKRRRVMLVIATIFVLAGLGFGLYWFLVARFYEGTDNAYVQGNVVQVTPQIAGTVLKIYADDTDSVRAGQPLVALDPADARVAAAQAEAQLAQTVREVRTLYANLGQAEANLSQRQADLAKAQDDLARRRALAGTGAVSGEELRHAEAAVSAARAAVDAAREQLVSGRALTSGTSVREHPNVQRAAARVRETLLAVQRSTLMAPVDGQVAKRSVQVGQRVSPGAPLMAVIPLNRLWVDANFKEGQLRDMRVGQPVTLTSDLYGGSVKYDGRVVGLAAGTGGAFALLPAQNATGNWIKVVQRVPVRISLDEKQLAEHPLRVGLSMQAEVDLHDRQGAPLATARETAVYSTGTPEDREAQARIEAIIAANLK